jgi:hypothetical protein
MREGKLSAAEAERLRALASRDTGGVAINILMSFDAIAALIRRSLFNLRAQPDPEFVEGTSKRCAPACF